jgi:leader peptidase (prepilin peptidase) / N-methyltransferase
MDISLLVFVFILGTIFGSFYNVVIYRLPQKISIAKGTSFCPNCHHRIMPWDLIPILSYVLLRGKCRYCNTHISIRYPLIELLTGFLFVLSFIKFGWSHNSLVAMILASLCLIITMIDLDTMEIPDRFHLLILTLAIIHIAFVSQLPLTDHIIGFFVISLPLYGIALLTNGMGGGDIKLVAVSGLLLGYTSMLVAFFIAAVTGGLFAVYLLIRKLETQKSLIAFGPYLCLGIFIAFLYGAEIIRWYLNLFI